MKKLKKVLSFALLSGVLLIFSCTKEGEQGESGTNGLDGNANVKSIVLTANSWAWNTTTSARYQVFSGITEITFDIASYGAVLLYQLNSGGTGYIQLPLTGVVSGGVVETDLFIYGEGFVEVQIQNSNLSDPISQIPIPTTYKLIVIPSTAKLSNPDIDYTNYYEVKGAFNLEE
ncbi:MAG: hypothetical protein HRT73_05640 [Flavobacteriales bacterium]|nr:hypothetical protein [Flavobacteriales bacterium]